MFPDSPDEYNLVCGVLIHSLEEVNGQAKGETRAATAYQDGAAVLSAFRHHFHGNGAVGLQYFREV